MGETIFETLLPHLTSDTSEGQTLWIADENLLLHDVNQIGRPQHLQVLTNRYDVYQHCEANQLSAHFTDYDLSAITDSSIERIVYRVSKEKPAVHHVINESFRVLREGGELVLAGKKSDGAKTYIEKASTLLSRRTPAKKRGNTYLGVIRKSRDYSAVARLDDKEYSSTRPIFELDGRSVISKPGLFGWDKQDQGSALLIECAEQFLQHCEQQPQSVLDLGCGYGYLILCSRRWPQIRMRWATDNNAAAVRCMQLNAQAHCLDVTVSADDCGQRIGDGFDLILCNPPFHQGFSMDPSLTDKFLHNSHKRLNAHGTALFVVSQFIRIEDEAAGIFHQVTQLGSDGQFKVLALAK